MSSANFNEMTQGIDQKAISSLYDDIHSVLIKDADNALTKGLKPVETALKDGWEGEDREVFIQNLTKLAEKISATLVLYDKAIADCFQQLIADWVEFQSKNVVAQ